MLGVCSLSVLGSCMSYYSCLFLCMEKERSRITAVQMDKVRGLLGIKRVNKSLNARIRELCGVAKRLMKVFSNSSAM